MYHFISNYCFILYHDNYGKSILMDKEGRNLSLIPELLHTIPYLL